MKLIKCLIFSSLLFTALSCNAEEFIIANGDSRGLLTAITLANKSPEADVITLSKHGLYAISVASGANLLPCLENSLVINGNGAEIRRYTNAPVSMICTDKKSRVVLRELILAEGSEGALVNYGDLLLDRVKIVDTNSGKAEAIISNFGRLSLSNSELAYNQMAIQAHDAGVIINHGELSLSFSKIHDNTIRLRKKPFTSALGVLNFGALKINQLTISANDIDPAMSPLQFPEIINIGKARIYGRYTGKQLARKSVSRIDTVANN